MKTSLKSMIMFFTITSIFFCDYELKYPEVQVCQLSKSDNNASQNITLNELLEVSKTKEEKTRILLNYNFDHIKEAGECLNRSFSFNIIGYGLIAAGTIFANVQWSSPDGDLRRDFTVSYIFMGVGALCEILSIINLSNGYYHLSLVQVKF